MIVDVLNRAEEGRVSSKAVARLGQLLLECLEQSSETEVSILLTDDTEIHALNLAFRGMDRPTDVLSFSMQEGMGIETPLLGDIVLSLDTVSRQARQKGWSLGEEVGFLLLHGLLHLLGYDHERDADARVMDEKTDGIWHSAHPQVIEIFDCDVTA